MGECVFIFWLFWFPKENKMALSLGVFNFFREIRKADALWTEEIIPDGHSLTMDSYRL